MPFHRETDETCQGCRHWEPAPHAEDGAPWCYYHHREYSGGHTPDPFLCGPGDRCNNFVASLGLRQVRALEEIAQALKGGPRYAAVVLINDKGELLAVPQDGR